MNVGHPLRLCAFLILTLAISKTYSSRGISGHRDFPEASQLNFLQRLHSAGQLGQIPLDVRNRDSELHKDTAGLLSELTSNILSFMYPIFPGEKGIQLDNHDATTDGYSFRGDPLSKLRVSEFLGTVTEHGQVSSKCVTDTGRLLIGVIERRAWALRFLDAMGKPNPGISEIQVHFVGDYHLCRSLEAPPGNGSVGFKGSYNTFKAEFGPPNMSSSYMPLMVQWGVCMPSSCNETENTQYLAEALDLISVDRNVLRVRQSEIHSDHREASTATIVAIAVLSIIGLLMLAGTLYDVLCLQWPLWTVEWTEKETSTNSSEGDRGCRGGHTTVDVSAVGDDDPLLGKDSARVVSHPLAPSGKCCQILLAFSVYTNARKVLTTTQSPGSISCIHGIRFLSMNWVILGHMFAFGVTDITNFFTEFPSLLHRWTFAAVSNAFVTVDTFFLISGLLTAYVTFGKIKRTGWRINWGLFYFHRFWRLTPPYMLVILMTLGLQQYCGQGPLWPSISPNDKHSCETNWWTNMLYINNLVHNSLDMCFFHTWYLANDMQFFLISPIMLLALYYNKRLGVIVCCSLLLMSSLITGFLSVQKQWPPSLVDWQSPGWDSYFPDYYIAPWCRVGPFVIGILIGYVLVERPGNRLRMSRTMALIGWLVAGATMLAVLYGLQGDLSMEHPMPVQVAALYNSVARDAWAVSVAWVILACLSGWGGFVNAFLSWSPFVFLGRLSYVAYLVHPTLIYIFYQRQQTLSYLDPINLALAYMGILVATYCTAFILVLAFESPMIGLEKIFLPKTRD